MNNFSQIGIYMNVSLNIIDKRSNRVVKSFKSRNRVTKYALNTIAKFLKGDFNSTTIPVTDATDVFKTINSYIPKFIAFGTGQNPPSYTDTKITEILHPYPDDPGSGYNDRIRLASSRILNHAEDVDLILRAYVPSESYLNGTDIFEIGLFSSQSGDTLISRVLIKDTKNELIQGITGPNVDVQLVSPSTNPNVSVIFYDANDEEINAIKGTDYTIDESSMPDITIEILNTLLIPVDGSCSVLVTYQSNSKITKSSNQVIDIQWELIIKSQE